MVRGRSGECDIRTERMRRVYGFELRDGLNAVNKRTKHRTPLIKEQSIDIAEYVAGYIQRFYDSVNQTLKDLI